MRIFVFVNRIQEIGYRQTTSILIAALHRRGFEVFLCNASGLSVSCRSAAADYLPTSQCATDVHPGLIADSIQLSISQTDTTSDHVADFAAMAMDDELTSMALRANDVILIRTNPGRDSANQKLHDSFLQLCQIAQASGVRVINQPDRLGFFASKAAVVLLPRQFRPEMLVTNDHDQVRRFVEDAKRDCIAKPLIGSRGNDVIRLNAHLDLESELSRFHRGPVVVQHFVESHYPGDKRVLVWNGSLIEHEGHLAGIHRVPAGEDFRANLHAGGQAHPVSLEADEQSAVMASAELLQSAGIQLAGIDLIGSKVIEFNVFSTGGLYDANRFSDFDFSTKIVDDLANEINA